MALGLWAKALEAQDMFCELCHMSPIIIEISLHMPIPEAEALALAESLAAAPPGCVGSPWSDVPGRLPELVLSDSWVDDMSSALVVGPPLENPVWLLLPPGEYTQNILDAVKVVKLAIHQIIQL